MNKIVFEEGLFYVDGIIDVHKIRKILKNPMKNLIEVYYSDNVSVSMRANINTETIYISATESHWEFIGEEYELIEENVEFSFDLSRDFSMNINCPELIKPINIVLKIIKNKTNTEYIVY